MLQIKFDQDWPPGLRDIKFKSVDDGRMPDHCYAEAHLVSLWLRWAKNAEILYTSENLNLL